MQRLIVVLLAALDAAIAAAVGLATVLAPLTLLWVLAFGLSADWGSLWPVSGTLWQFAHGVPIEVVLPDTLLSNLAISKEAAQFGLSVPPLAILVFTLLFGARSGRRAAVAGTWYTGVASGAVTFTLITVLVALTAQADILRTTLWTAVVVPASVYLFGLLAGAVAYAWAEGDSGPIDRIHDVVDGWGEWTPVPTEAVRGAAIAMAAMMGAAAVGVAAMTLLRGGEVVALFERLGVDALGATMLTLAHLLYLPTLLIWGASWLAGPGFALGTGTAVSPAGTELGVVPGIPVLGLIPEDSTMWMLVSVLVPIACGALAGWMVRSRLVWERTANGYAPRAAIAVGIAALSAGAAAIAATLAAGSIGPGRLSQVGPVAGPLALAVGIEVLIGSAILLLAPRHRDELAEERTDRWREEMAEWEGASGTD
ncbi:cell division protein PerM [Microbacterium alcoholitolerans]|uniref:cell division protein PerM n=1 Tax=unclassified Microbacterium TaxID=2609290 RepID=UPI003D18307B